jgi:tripartite-type tricarboxylate transporter receptor subunit TctC
MCSWRIFKWVRTFLMVCMLGATPVMAQDFPSRPIELIVGFAPGGGTDMTARALANGNTKYLGQPIVVTNKAGASGTLAAQYVTSAKPDGYTLLVGGGSETIAVGHFRKLPYDPVGDFECVMNVVRQSISFSVRADSPWKTFQDFVADAKKNPDKYSYASSGVGSLYHAAGMVLEKKTGIRLRHVPFKGGAETLTGVLGGHVDLAVSAPDEAFALIEAKKVRPLVVFSATRDALIPDVPTLKEVGIDFYMENMKGLMAPKGTPKAVVQKIHDGVKRMMAEDPAFRDSLKKVNLEMRYLNGEDFRKALQFMYALIGEGVK